MKEESALTTLIFSAIYVVVLCYQAKNALLLSFVQKAYLGYVKVKLGDQNISWAPHKACKTPVEL